MRYKDEVSDSRIITTVGTVVADGVLYDAQLISNGVASFILLTGPRGGEYYLSPFEDDLWGVYALKGNRPLKTKKDEHVHIKVTPRKGNYGMEAKYL